MATKKADLQDGTAKQQSKSSRSQGDKRKQKARKSKDEEEEEEDDDEEEDGDEEIDDGEQGPKRRAARRNTKRSTSKTYEEPSNISILNASQVSWLNVTSADTEQAGCVVVKECFSPRGLPFVVTLLGKQGGALVLTATKRIQLRCTAEASGAMVVAGSISSRGTRVAGATDTYVVYLWDVSNWNDPRILYAVHTSARTDSFRRGDITIELSPSGALLMVHERDAPIFVWSAMQTQTSQGMVATTAKIVATLQGPSSRGIGVAITSAAFTNDPEEKYLVASFVANAPGDVKHYDCCVYNIAQGSDDAARTTLTYPVAFLRGHDARILGVNPSIQYGTCYTATADGRSFGWKLENHRCFMFLSHPTRTLAQHIVAIPDGAHVATTASDGFIRIWGCYPHYPRNNRGFVPVVCRLNPPTEVCKRGAYMVHLTYEHPNLALTVIWRCNESAPFVPAPVSDSPEDTYAFVPIESKAVPPSESVSSNKKLKFEAISAALGSNRSSSSLAAEPSQNEPRNAPIPARIFVAVTYRRIPCLVARYRSDVALLLKLVSLRHKMPVSLYRLYTNLILRCLG